MRIALQNLLRLAEEEALSPQQMAAIAIAANDIARTTSEALSTLKQRLRKAARNVQRGSPSVEIVAAPQQELLSILNPEEFEALHGLSISVHFPKPKISVVGDLDELKARIGHVAFSRYFDSKVVYSPQGDVLQTIAKDSTDPANSDAARIVLEYLKDSEETPRVRFPRTPLSNPFG